MPVYKVRFKDEVVNSLDSEAPKVRVGRSDECELQIDNLGISRFHAVIELQSGVRVLRDLGSHNGVFFNGKPVKERVVNDGDVFVIGKFRLEYSDPQHAQSEPEPADAGPGVDEVGMKTFAIDPTALAHLQQAERVKGHLKRLGDGKTIELRQTLTTFGKSDRCDFRIKGWFMAPVMAIVIRDERGFIICNTTGNPQKVFVQGRPLAMYVRLENGFRLRIGREEFSFNSGRAVD